MNFGNNVILDTIFSFEAFEFTFSKLLYATNLNFSFSGSKCRKGNVC